MFAVRKITATNFTTLFDLIDFGWYPMTCEEPPREKKKLFEFQFNAFNKLKIDVQFNLAFTGWLYGEYETRTRRFKSQRKIVFSIIIIYTGYYRPMRSRLYQYFMWTNKKKFLNSTIIIDSIYTARKSYSPFCLSVLTDRSPLMHICCSSVLNGTQGIVV